MDANLARCLAVLTSATQGLSNAHAKQRVDGRWSIAEIVEHLQRAYAGTARGLERIVETGTPLATPLTLRQQLRIFVVVTVGYFPPGRAAPKHVVPTGLVELDAALGAARESLERLDRAADAARRRFGTLKVLDHPILGAFTVNQWHRFHWIHTRHHERQIRDRRPIVEKVV
jgi:hypothetical protein